MTAGVLVIDKPEALTSHDVVAAARRALGERRIGHCGTLDPMATGVLALAIGPATRLVQFLSGETKHYDAVIRFGIETTTYDATGEVMAETGLVPAPEALDVALQAFRATFAQTPPPYSAKKVAGVRAYHLARRHGPAAAALPPVNVICHDLTLTAFGGGRASVSMAVSAGFYVRSLAHDLGRALGTGAVLERLRRTRSGRFDLEAAVPFSELVQGDRDRMAARVQSVDRLLPDLPAMSLSSDEVQRVRHGVDMPVPPDWTGVPPLTRMVDEGARLVALAVPAGRHGFLHPSVVLG